MSKNKPQQVAEGSYIAQADRGGVASVNVVQEISILSPSEKRNRLLMLDKVYDFWIRDVLYNSLYMAVLIDLGMEYKPEAVTYPWKLFFREAGERSTEEISSNSSIVNVFDEYDGELLILGAPGSGKTTTLLHLTNILLERAHQDDTLPIPVVLNLSSWTEQQLRFDDWIVDELNIRYGVPVKIGQAWVQSENILLLLDGLDEVNQAKRGKCIEVINDYRVAHGFTSMVVCSRTPDYEILETRLKLQGAILIQPLTNEQVDSYLEQLGETLSELRLAVNRDGDLQSMAQSPLLLNIMVMAYGGDGGRKQISGGNPEEKRSDIFATYVTKMFDRRLDHASYSSKDTVSWLTWLARQMQRNGQTVFFLENIQPSWLGTRSQRQVYSFILNILVKVGMAILLGLFVGLPFGRDWGIGVGLLAVLFSRIKSNTRIQTVDTLGWSWGAFRMHISHGLFAGLITAAIFLFFSVLTGFIVSPFFLGSVLAIGIANSIFNALAGGFTGNQIEVRNRPNQGIRRSFYNSLLGGVAYAVIGGISSIVLFPVVRDFSLTLLVSVGVGFFAGFLRRGGYTLMQHYAIRLILWWNRSIPFDYISFLDYAVDRIFLRRVGGGYIFIHRLPMEYFASLGKGAPDEEIMDDDNIGFISLIVFLLAVIVVGVIALFALANQP